MELIYIYSVYGQVSKMRYLFYILLAYYNYSPTLEKANVQPFLNSIIELSSVQSQAQRWGLIQGVFAVLPVQLGARKLFDSKLCGLEAYVEGSLYVIALRLLRPCHKPSDVNPTIPLFPKIRLLSPNAVDIIDFRLGEYQVFPLAYFLVK